MIEEGQEHEFIIVLSGLFPETIEPLRAAFDGLLPQSRIRVWNAPGPVSSQDTNNNWRRFVAEYLRETFIASLEPDVVHISSLVEGFGDDAVHSIGLVEASHGTAVTFYDVIPLLQSEVYLRPNPLFEPVYLEKIEYLKRADMVLAISESSRQEAIEHLAFEPDAVVDIAAAADDCFRPIDVPPSIELGLRRKLRLPRPFILYTGATDDRKNHVRLIQAYGRLPRTLRTQYQLAIVGRLPQPHRDAFEKCALACGLTLDDVVITGNVDDDELIQLYNLCALFVFPSWHEGFGLPVLEAMSCGAAVIGSNNTSVPEVIGREDALFDPFDVDSIAEKIVLALTDEPWRNELRRHALQHAKSFSWKRSAQVALAHIEAWYERRQHASESAEPQKRTPQAYSEQLVRFIGGLPGKPSNELELIRVASAIAQNLPQPRSRRLYVDVSELATRDSRSGIQRVVRAVLQELSTRPPAGYTVEAVATGVGKHGYFHARNFMRRFAGLPDIGLAEESIDEAQPGDIFLGLDFQAQLVVWQRNYLQRLRDRGVRVLFVIYDLLPVTRPDTFPPEWDQARAHMQWLDVVAHSDGAICISRAVADEYLQWLDCYGAERQRSLPVDWFHLGSDIGRSMPTRGVPSSAKEVLAAAAGLPTFLAVATLEPRKGHQELLDAADANWTAGHEFVLVLVGRKGWSVDSLVQRISSHAELNKRLFWISSASDEYLDLIFRNSDCLVAASEAEGFGLPVVEGASHGLSVIARDIPVFREVAPADSFFFDSTKGRTLDKVMRECMARPRVARASRSGVATTNWQQSCETLVETIRGRRSYRQWSPPKGVIRLWAADPRFGTTIGERDSREVVVRPGKVGCALYGPYLHLAPGRYEVVLRGRLLEPNLADASVDIVLDGGDQILAEAPLKPPSSTLTAVLARLTIAANEHCDNLEVRVWVRGSAHFAITMVEVRPVD